MSMLKKATNKMAYAKVGLYGDAGSGKTVTAALLAIGLHKYAKLTKPVAMFDTEPGASFIIPLFEAAGIEFMPYDESRALKDILAFLDEAEKECSIFIGDSITHVWRDVQESYLKKINEARAENRKPPITSLEFQDWNPIKAAWRIFTNRYLSSKLHCIICGRAGSIYRYQTNERTGKKELVTDGTKMATEKELGYEPSLLIEMVKHREKGRIINRCLIEKDRSMNYNGYEFDFLDKDLKYWRQHPDTVPKPFQLLMKHFEALNLGGQHFESMDNKDSADMFNAEGEDNWSAEKRQREIWCEEIKGLMVKHNLDGTSGDVKKRRMEILQSLFGTMSWTAVESMRSDRIKQGFEEMRAMLEPPQQSANDMDADENLDKAVNQ